MNTEDRLKKLLAEVNAPQTVEERLDAIERTLAMAFEVQAAQQKLILMLCDRYGSAKTVEELTAIVRHQREIIREREARIGDLESEIDDANDVSGISRVTSNGLRSGRTFMGVIIEDIQSSSTPEWVKEAYAKWLAGPGGIWTTGGDRP